MADFEEENLQTAEENNGGQQQQQPANGGKKKQKKTCLGCFVTALFWIFSVTLVLNLIVGVAAYFVADYYSKQYLDMSAGEIISIVSGAANSNENKVVPKNNRYSQDDLKGFYTGIKDQVFLSESFDLRGEIENTVVRFLDETQKQEGEISTSSAAVAEENGEEGGNFYDEALNKLLKAENFNLGRLKGFDYDHPENFTNYVLTDKQLAAFLNDVLNNERLTGFIDAAILEQLGFALNLRFSVDQVVFFVDENCEYREWSEPVEGEESTFTTKTGDVYKMKLTASVHIRQLVRSFLKIYDVEKFSYFFNFLPKSVFLSVEIPLDKDALPMAYLNSMDSAKMKSAFKLADNLTKMLTGEPIGIEKMLADIGSNTLYPVIKMVNEAVPVKMNNGSITVSPLDIVLSMLFSGSDADVKPEGKDVFLAFKTLITVDEEEMAKIISNPHRHAYYVTDDVTGVTTVKILMTDAEVAELENYIKKNPDGGYYRHLDAMYDELSQKYFIDIRDFDDLMELIKGGLNTEDKDALLDKLSEKFSSENFKGAYDDPNLTDDDMKLLVTDYMLAELLDLKFADLLDTIMKKDDIAEEGEAPETEDGGFDYMSLIKHLRTEQVVISNTGEGADTRSFIKLTVSMSTRAMIAQMQPSIPEPYYSFLIGLCDTQQLAEKLYITAILDITIPPEVPEGEESEFQSTGTIILLNSVTSAQMDRLLAITAAFGFGAGELTKMIDDSVKPMLTQLNGQIPVKFVSSEKTDSGAIATADIFSLIITLAGLKVNDGGGERLMTSAEIRTALRALDYAAALSEQERNKEGIFTGVPEDTALLESFIELENNLYLPAGTLSYSVDSQIIQDWYDGKVLAGDLAAGMDAAEMRRLYIDAMNKAAVDKLTGGNTTGGISSIVDDIKGNLVLHTAGDKPGLLDDTRTPADLDLLIKENALAALIQTFMSSQNLMGIDADVVMVRLEQDTRARSAGGQILKIMVSVDIQNMTGSAGSENDTVALMRKFLPDGSFERLYIEISCYIDSVITDEDGSRYEMDLDINNLIGSGKRNEYDTLMLILDTFGMKQQLEDAKLAISKSIYNSLGSLSSGSDIEYEITDQGISLGNIYSLLISTAGLTLKEGESERPLAPTELWMIIHSLNRGGEITANNNGLYDEIFLSNTGGGLGAVAEELEDKYYLQETVFRDGDNNIKSDTELVEMMTGEGSVNVFKDFNIDSSIRVNAVSGKMGILDDDRTPSKGLLDVKLSAAALKTIIEEKMGDTSLGAEVMQIRIYKKPASNSYIMEIVVKAARGDLMGAGGGLADFLPDNELDDFYFLLSCDLGEVEQDGDGKYYYATSADINYLAGDADIDNDFYADNDLLLKFISGMSDDAKGKIDNAAISAGKAIFDAIKVMEDNIGEIGFYEKECDGDYYGGGLVLPHVFVLIAEKLNITEDEYYASLSEEDRNAVIGGRTAFFYDTIQSTLQNIQDPGNDIPNEIVAGSLTQIIAMDNRHLHLNFMESFIGLSEQALGAHFRERSANNVTILNTNIEEDKLIVVAKIEFTGAAAKNVSQMIPQYLYAKWELDIDTGKGEISINELTSYENKMAALIFDKMSDEAGGNINELLEYQSVLDNGFVRSGETLMIDGLDYLCYSGDSLPPIFGI